MQLKKTFQQDFKMKTFEYSEVYFYQNWIVKFFMNFTQLWKMNNPDFWHLTSFKTS